MVAESIYNNREFVNTLPQRVVKSSSPYLTEAYGDDKTICSMSVTRM